MRRWNRLLLVALLLPGCALVRESSIEEGPEQFRFTVTAGPGAGPAGDALARDFSAGPGDELVPDSARLVASVATPLGQVDVVRFQVISQGKLNDCEGEFTSAGSLVGCGSVGGLVDPLGGSAIAVSGSGSVDTWSSAMILVAPAVATIVAVAEDGTRYTIVPASGFGYVVWPSSRGSLTLTALDADGAALGTAEALSPEAGPPPAPIN